MNKQILILIVISLFLINTNSFAGELYFKGCDDCLHKIEEAYKIDKVNIIQKIFYKYFLNNNPYKIPNKYRCQAHKNQVLIKELKSDKFLGKNIKVGGVFMGWSGKYGPPPVTRSDWIITDESKKSFIYVTGGLPKGVHPMNKKDYGKKIIINGVLRKKQLENGNVQYYIEYSHEENINS